MPHWTARLDRLMVVSTRILALVGLLGLLILAGATIVDVFLRYAFNSPIDGLSDLAQLVIIFMVAATFPASLAGRHQITVRFMGKILSWRLREGVELFGHLLTLLVFAGLAWRLVLYTEDLFLEGQTTWLLAIPMWPSWTISTILIVLCIPVQAGVCLIQFMRMVAPAEPGHGSPGEESRDETGMSESGKFDVEML